MNTFTTRETENKSSGNSSLLYIPNILTFLRIASVPAMIFCVLVIKPPLANWIAVCMFITVAITDFLDGYLARIWSQQSALGRILDPTADKLLVVVCLLLLTEQDIIRGWSIWAAAIILCRELLVSGLRELLGEKQVRLPVIHLSKWKTSLQFIAIGMLLTGDAGQAIHEHILTIGLTFLWASAILTMYTGYTYLRTGISVLIE